MITFKHTPGPWMVSADSTTISARHPLRGHTFEIVTVHYAFQHDQHKANTRLIAAAPELLEALQGMVALHEQRELVRGTSYDDVRVTVARATIAKAVQS